jgi:undecaprenyl diphosphate synthase
LTAPASGRERATEPSADPEPVSALSALGETELLVEVRRRPLPRHLAVIMDGNGRWARARGLPRVAGHREGIKATREAVRIASRVGLEYLTVYAFSSENWARPAAEVGFLMRLLESSVEAELPSLMANGVRLRMIGAPEALSPGVQTTVARVMAATAANTGLTLQIALNYGARGEIVRAVRTLAARVLRGELDPSAIEEADVASALDTAGAPDPDLLIRTSGERRLSNFLLWQAAYTELLVLPTLWPDFTARDLLLAIADFQRRSRRFGGV